MPAKTPISEDEFFFSFADAAALIRKKRKLIIGTGLLCMAIAFCYALFQPITYEAKALFREKNSSGTAVGGALASFFGKGGDEASASAIMPSRRVAEDVVQKIGLHTILKPVKKPGIIDFANKKFFLEKLAIQNRYNFSENKEDIEHLFHNNKALPVSCRLHQHKGGDEFCRSLIIEPLADLLTYKLWDKKKTLLLGTYSLGQKVVLSDCSFSLEGQNFTKEDLSLNLLPASVIADKLKLKLGIKKDKENSKFLHITYKNDNPAVAALVVNQFIASYKEFLDTEHQQTIAEQLSYLQKRQTGLLDDCDQLMQENAVQVKSYIENHGIRGLSTKDEGFAKLDYNLSEQLRQIQTDLMILDTKDGIELIKTNGLASDLLNERQKLIQERELLQIALQEEKAGQEEGFDKNWAAYSEELGSIQKESKLLTEMQIRLGDVKALELFWEQVKDIALIQKWGIRPFFEESRGDEWLGHLEKYLDNMSRFLKMRENLIRERLSYKKIPHKIYQGLDLSSARSIQFNLIGSIQAQTSQSNRLALASKRLEDTKCDLGTLSSSFGQDEYVRKHLLEASEINFRLQDSYNNSPKEHERLKNNLHLKRIFLQMHVRETNTVNQLQKKLTEQELVFLKINMLELYNQTIAVIEEQIKGLQKKLKSNLHKEESFIKGSIVEANSQAGSLPMQWLQQEKIAMFKEMNIKVMTELVKTIESKNIAQNIERMESAAIDEARAPLMPERPQLFLWASFGLVAGLIGSLFTCVFIEIKKGLVATEHNLELQGYTSLGELKESPEDIDTVRRAISFINQHAHLKTIYIIGDTFKKPFELLAHLLAIQGERVLFLEASCFDPNETSGGKDFELYLIGQNPEVPTPESLQEGYHKLKMGEYSAFATEFMNTHKFKDLLESFVNVYDKIIIFIPLDPVKTLALIATANAEILLVVSKERRLTELAPYMALDKPVGFFL